MSTRTLFLRLDAPFSAFRWLQAGVYRGTFPVMPPSAAWGFALNLAGIETRGRLDVVESTADVRWFVPVNTGERPKESTRLTTNINRQDASRTVAPLFAPTSPQPCPDAAWVDVGPAAPSG